MAKVVSSSIRRMRPRIFDTSASVTNESNHDTNAQLTKLQQAIARSQFSSPTGRDRLAQELLFDVLGADPYPTDVRQALFDLTRDIIDYELTPLYTIPEAPAAEDTLSAYETRREITAQLEYLEHQHERLALFRQQLRRLLELLARASKANQSAPSPLAIRTSRYTLQADPVSLIDEITRQFFTVASNPDDTRTRPGTRYADMVVQNVLAASKLTFDEAQHRPYRILWPEDYKDSVEEVVSTYLAHTPLANYLNTQVDLSLPDTLLPEVVNITANPGHGKTQLLQWMVLRHLENPSRPSVVVMDSQGDCLRVLSHLKRFDPELGHNLTIIDPTDDWPPALNLFAWNRELAENLNEIQREEMLAGIIETFKFTCEGLFGTGLTPRMQLVFQYLALWLLQIPNANLLTLIDLLRDPTEYLQYTLALSPTAQGFIEELFAPKSQYRPTREHILSRLHAVVGNPLFERMFAHPQNKFDIGTAMNKPAHVTLINTAKGQLKAECSALFGRFWLARIYQAMMARAFIPQSERRLSIVLVDEAHEYLEGAETTLAQLLFQARKYRVSINLIHQTLDQYRKAGVLGPTLGVPALRFTGNISDGDAGLFAKEMNTTPEFLKSVRKTSNGAEWAVFARNLTQTATKTTIPYFEAEREEKLSAAAYQQLLERNRQLVGAPRRPHEVKPQTTTPLSNDGDSY